MSSTPTFLPSRSGRRWLRGSAAGRWILPQGPLPTWARALDIAVLVVLIAAGLVATFGGFRERIGDMRLSVTSWERLVLLAAALGAVRHVLARQQPLAARVLRAWSVVRAAPVTATVLPAFVGTRFVVLAAGFLGVVLIGFVPNSELFRVADAPLPNLLARWDAGWYAGIVQDGYTWDGNRLRQQNVVFFPAMPVFMYLLGLFMGRQWLLAGAVVALAAFAWALVYVYRFARDTLGEDAAQAAPWLIAAYPFAVYFGAPYTESLFLLGAVGAFYHLERGEWAKAAGWGLLVGLCRPNGFLLAAPLGWIALRRVWSDRAAWRQLIVPAAPVLGLLSYALYLWMAVGDPLAWLKGQRAWGRIFVGIWPGLQALFVDRYSVIAHAGVVGYVAQQPMDALNTCAALFVVATLWPVTRRLGLAYGAFLALNLFPPMVMGGMMSIGRMTSVLFPAFVWLGAVVPAAHRMGWVAAWAMLQGLVAVLFFTWRPAF